MKLDYHVHTYLCGHAEGTVEESIESAIAKGFDEIGIADHLPLLYVDDPSLSMSRDQLEFYVDTVQGLKERYRSRIKVLLGIEADYHPPTLDDVASMLSAHPFDYVIGSIHIVGNWIFDDPRELKRYDGLDLDRFYIEYLESLKAMTETGLYDIVGHPDLVKKFDKRASVDLAPHYRSLLEAIDAAGMCYEVNTAGLRWPAREVYPEVAFVKLAAGIGVPVTLGSDAHKPDDVGRDFETSVKIIQDSGYTELAAFEGREMRMVPLRP